MTSHSKAHTTNIGNSVRAFIVAFCGTRSMWYYMLYTRCKLPHKPHTVALMYARMRSQKSFIFANTLGFSKPETIPSR